MIKTLVAIEVDLASSMAIRYACQLGNLVDMELYPVYVKEPPSGGAHHRSGLGAAHLGAGSRGQPARRKSRRCWPRRWSPARYCRNPG